MDSIDDKEDMQFADEAFDILGFTKEEKYNVYKVTSVVMHLGEMKFKKKSAKDDQAAADGTEAGKKIATLLGKIMPYPWDMQLEPVCCKKRQKIVPDQLLVCRVGDL